jgi:hypothetical protein
MNRTMHTLRAVLALLPVFLAIPALAQVRNPVPQPPFEQRSDEVNFNFQSTGGVPISSTSGTPPGSNGRGPTPAQQEQDGLTAIPATSWQFQGRVTFGALVAPRNQNLNSNISYVANATASNLDLPRGESGGQILLVMPRARVGAPWLGRQISFPFGAVIPLPLVNVEGDPLPSGTPPEDYWFAEPHRPTTLAPHEIANLVSLANKLRTPTEPVATFVASQLSAETTSLLTTPNDTLRTALVLDLNDLITGASIYTLSRFSNVVLSLETEVLDPGSATEGSAARINRLLLEDAFPGDLARSSANYYWSPHSRAVFAIQSGPVDVTWKRRLPVTDTPADYNSNPARYSVEFGNYYELFATRYVISGSAVKPPRKIYWTEGPFRSSGWPVAVPPGRVGVVNVVNNNNFPRRVEQAYRPLGQTPIVSDPSQQLEETRTLWYDKELRQILAYNAEGRVFVELLGDSEAGGRTRRPLGFEIVDVIREPRPADVTTELGDVLTAFPPKDLVDDSGLFPEPLASGAQNYIFRHSETGNDRPVLYATRETQNLNDVQVHWLETGVEGLRWPFLFVRYLQKWPGDVARYSHYLRPLVATEAEARATAVPLPADNAPIIEYQDPLDQPRGKLTETFAFYSFLNETYPAHRTLMRFSAGDNVRFERIFSWLDQSLRHENLTVPSFVSDFSTAPAGAAVYGNARVSGGILRLTDAQANHQGSYIIDDFVNGEAVENFRARFHVSLRESTSLPADGFSFNFGTVPDGVFAFGEEGTTDGLSVSFDSWDNGAGDIAPGIAVYRNGTLIGSVAMAESRNPNPEPPETLPVPTDPATGQGMTLVTGEAFVPVEIVLRSNGTLDVSYKGVKVLANLVTGYTPRTGRFGLGARTGGAFVSHWVEDMAIVVNENEASGVPSFVNSVASQLDSWIAGRTYSWPDPFIRPRVVSLPVAVGQRILPPSGEIGASAASGYLAGYIQTSQGTAYNPWAYRDPFSEGFEVANQGAIIPVNAMPGNDRLEVWWFRQNTVDLTRGFKTIFWPSVIGRYDIDWPQHPREIVLASNDGSGALVSLEAKGQIYYQNDRSLHGFNPNEEHALMQGGQAFALRDDLNVITGPQNQLTSLPYVLLDYVEADNRPAMQVFKVRRERPETGDTFDYVVEAGAILQPPMPLPLLEKPFAPKIIGTPPRSLNREVGWWTVATSAAATTSVTGVGDLTEVTLTTLETHGFRAYQRLALQDLSTNPPPLRYFYPTAVNYQSQTLTGIATEQLPDALQPWLLEQTSDSDRWRYGVTHLTGLATSQIVVIADLAGRASWAAEIVETNIVDGSSFVEVRFATADDRNAATNAPALLRPLEDGAADDFKDWRLAFEPVPAAITQPTLRDTYASFLLQDRKGNLWVYRGPHDTADVPTVAMQFYYKTLTGFFFPSQALDQQPPVGTITPYLRAQDTDGTYLGDPVHGNLQNPQAGDDNALFIHYHPVWPADAPVLQMAESLTLPKRGLPAVRGQTSLEVIYQQSYAVDGEDANTVVLHDPTRERQFDLGPADGVGVLGKIPDSVRTQPYRGKTYFPNLPPHLSERFFFDPNRGEFGALVFAGQFVDEALGDDYLLLNVLGVSDRTALKELCLGDDPARGDWNAAIEGLVTRLELFVENPAKPGTYIASSAEVVPPANLAAIGNDDIAVDSYALTAIGPGTGYVTLISGNGLAFTPAAEPVSIHVMRVVDTLYRGELKIIAGSNPLAETLILQQVVDLAGQADAYNFEWKIASPVDGLPPDVYVTTRVPLLLDGTWNHLRFPVQGDRATTVGTLPAARVVSDVTTQVRAISRINFGSPVVRSGDQFAFPLSPGANPSLEVGTALVMRSSEGQELNVRVHGLSTASSLVVAVDPGQLSIPSNFTVLELYERSIPNQPQSIVFREFTRPATLVPNEVWLSLNLDAAMGARVYLDGQWVVSANLGDEDSTRSTPPGNFSPLSQAYRLSGSSLAGGVVQPNGTVKHRMAVELYSTALPDEQLVFNVRIETNESVDVTDAGWITLDGTRHPDGVRALLGGQADVRALADNYLIMRYQAKATNHASFVPNPSSPTQNIAWSSWTRPQLAEGWIKRVLAGINPFNQRVQDLFANAVNTDVSILQQAGPRWEGDVALNLDVINQFGLIEIYETVLRRGKKLSIDAGINFGPANDALLLAAGYLNDLYVMIGNEAWADAANPTIGIGTKDHTYGDIATALFAFRGQLPSVLEEELALLRGRDDFLLPGVEIRPVYNRLLWNYTRGIDAGEVVYALNYNILDLDENGRVDADDARRLYPQGHGDAYGHYLTALKGYYTLLMDTDFDWVPRIEAVTVLGQPVSVDYQDERKFAAAAAAMARSGKQILDLTWRRDFQTGRGIGWQHLAESRVNTRRPLPTTRAWGVDHWATRTGQGAYLNWVVGNALLPDVDPDPSHEGGIQQVDRTTVLELMELPALADSVQAALDNAEAGMNPLGLPDNAVPFDINPSLVVGGAHVTHFEQIYDRARSALRNALVAFDDAKDVTRLMRSEEDSLADFRTTVNRQELSYTNALIELYGTPYPDDIGPGRTFRTGYSGPDLVHYDYVDLAELSTSLLDPTSASEWRIDTQTFVLGWVEADGGASDFNWLTMARVNGIDGPLDPNYEANDNLSVGFTLNAHGFFEKPSLWKSRRMSPGRIQQAISDIIKARNAAYLALYDLDAAKGDLDWALNQFELKKNSHQKIRDWKAGMLGAEQTLEAVKAAVEIVDKILDVTADQISSISATASKSLPTVFIAGLAAGGDLTSPARAAIESAGVTFKSVTEWKKVGTFAAIKVLEVANETQKRWIEFSQIEAEQWEQELRDATGGLRDKVYGVQNKLPALNQRLQELDDAQRKYRSLLAEGDRIQQERQIFRQRAAAVIQGFRTRDAAFRIFRNEKLERYKALFDLAAQYAYMSAQAFDYETGLLHTDQGRRFIARTVQARALGVMTGGEPQFAGSNTGDPGLSSVLAEMQADWLVLKGRLGFNNPDAYGTTVSLRMEDLRLLPGMDGDEEWKDQLSQGRMANLLDDPDVRRYCLQLDPGNGLAAPGIVLSFSTTIADGLNLFGRPLAAGDHAFSPSSFATKIHAIGIALEGYRGMDNPGANSGAVTFGGGVSPTEPSLAFLDPNALSATPYVYLIPVGVDSMRSPPLGDSSVIRTWSVDDVAVPLPFNVGDSGFSTFPFWQSGGSLTEPLFAVRKHQAFRPVSSATLFPSELYGNGGTLQHSQYTNRRLIGRSAWNSRWKLVIPGRTLLHDPNEGLDRFIQTVRDVKLRFVTYSYAGN